MVSTLRQARNDARKERTRKRLLDAGAKVMVAKGYHRTLVSDIAGEAEVGQGTFYRHFDSKRELFQALFEDLVAELLGQFDAFSAQLPRNEQEYRAASLSAVLDVARGIQLRPALVRLFLVEGPSVDQAFATTLEEVFDQFAALAKGYLEHAVAGGFARPCDADVVAECLVGMAQRHLLRALRQPLDDEETRRIVEAAIAFAFDGLGKEETA